MTTDDRRERLDEIKVQLAQYLGVRTHRLLSEVIDVVASLLPADEPASAELIELPARFTDRDRDKSSERTSGAVIEVAAGGAAVSAYIEADQVDAFIAAVRKAAGR